MSPSAQRFPHSSSPASEEEPTNGTRSSACAHEIDAALTTVTSGSGALVWVAEPGMGKTALMDRVLGKLLLLRNNQQIVSVRVQAPAAGMAAAPAGGLTRRIGRSSRMPA